MINKEILTNNVPELSEEQATKLETIFNNALGQRIGEIHGQYDADILAVTGRQKPSGVKTYEHMKSILTEFKNNTSGEELKSQLEALKAEKQTLEEKLKSGEGSEVWTAKIQEKDNMINQLKTGFEAEKNEWQKQLAEKDQRMTANQENQEFDKAFSGLKRKDYSVISESLQQAAFKQEVADLKAETTRVFENGKMIFKDKDGKTLLNKKNNLEPYTATELLAERKAIKDILDEGKHAAGAGTGAQGVNNKVSISIGAAKTRVEGTEAIRTALFAEGLTVNDPEFQKRFDTAYKENEISKLPLK